MKPERPRYSRTALCLTAAALLATPAIAQDAQTATPPAVEQVTPPPVVPTVKPDGTPPASTQNGASTTPIDPAAQAQADAEEAERRQEARQPARARPARPETRTAVRARPTPRAATPGPAATPTAQPNAAAASAAPIAEPTAQPDAANAPSEQAPPPSDQVTQSSQTTTTGSGAPAWPLIAIGVLILAGIIGLIAMRRRAAARGQWNEPAHVEPAAAAPIVTPEPQPITPVARAAAEPAMIAPVDTAIAPAVPEDASLAEPEAADVAALTAATPVADRPWLEFSLRPVRAGANQTEALVEIELTVGNAGSIDAEDVRISTFMFPAGSTSDMERLLVQHEGDGAVAPMTIAAGEGTRVDATLVLPRADLIGDGQVTGFQPVVVADARYRLPDGSEGRTSASFVVGIASEGDLGVIDLAQPQIREDIEARLYREPARV